MSTETPGIDPVLGMIALLLICMAMAVFSYLDECRREREREQP